MEREFGGSIGIIKKVSTVRLNEKFKIIFLKIFIGSGKNSKTYIPGQTGH